MECDSIFVNQRLKSNKLGEISLCIKRISQFIEFMIVYLELERTIKYKFELEFEIKYKFEFAREFAATIPRDRTRTHYAL